jgi:hypothetical protein
MKIDYLTKRMGSGIGSPASNNLYWLIEQPGQRLFQLSLDRVVASGKPLPAPIPCSVIANIKPQISHIPPVPLLLPVRYPLKTGSILYDRTLVRDRKHFESYTLPSPFNRYGNSIPKLTSNITDFIK